VELGRGRSSGENVRELQLLQKMLPMCKLYGITEIAFYLKMTGLTFSTVPIKILGRFHILGKKTNSEKVLEKYLRKHQS